jgi:hypothetical protein
MRDMSIRTPETHPNHEVVGHLFVASDLMSGDSEIYYCDSYDPRQGYWMTLCNGIKRKNVSERAIDATFHTIRFDHLSPDGTLRAWSRWGHPFNMTRRAA